MEDRNSRADKIEAECSVLARRPGLYGRLNAVRGGKFPDDAGDPPNQAITSSLVVLLSFLVVLIITLSTASITLPRQQPFPMPIIL